MSLTFMRVVPRLIALTPSLMFVCWKETRLCFTENTKSLLLKVDPKRVVLKVLLNTKSTFDLVFKQVIPGLIAMIWLEENEWGYV